MSASSFSSVAPPGPLTTIFTPPSGCFETLPDVWQPCGTTDVGSTLQTRCYWSLPYSCYPFQSRVSSIIIWGFGTTLYPAVYQYSPGVLPSGYTQPSGAVDGGDAGTASGCWRGFTSEYFCTSSVVNGKWLDSFGSTHTGDFAALLPQVAVTWQSSDLSIFTPTSAPALPTESLLAYESSVAARSRTSNNVPATAAPSQPQGSSTGTSSPTSGGGGGLSTGAKAGIGVGVAVGALLVLGLLIWFWRRHKKQSEEYKPHHGYEGMRYNTGTAELPNNQMKPKELSAEHELQPVPAGRNPPPVPVASKPRFHTELE